MPEDYFGERVAERYDERYADQSELPSSTPSSRSWRISPARGRAALLGERVHAALAAAGRT